MTRPLHRGLKQPSTQAIREQDVLRMCLTCAKSRILQSVKGDRILTFYCDYHLVGVHYNETCEKYQYSNQASIADRG